MLKDQEIHTLADTIARLADNKPRASDVLFGTVKGLSAKMLDVLIDGASTPISVVRACNPVDGDRVVIVKKGTIWLAIAVVGGAPTIESGSNANGSWVKYPDGTMICWITTTINFSLMNEYGGGLWQNVWQWNYPQAFKSSDVGVTCGRMQWGTGASWGTGTSTITSSYAHLRCIDILYRAYGITYVSATAVGRWK